MSAATITSITSIGENTGANATDLVVSTGTMPLVTGTATLPPLGSLNVTIAGVLYTDVPVTGGNWQVQVPSTLADGDYPIVVEVLDFQGNVVVADSIAEMMTVDSTPPAIPTITSQTVGGDPVVFVTGGATLGADETMTVQVFDDTGAPFGTPATFTPADITNGSWTMVLPFAPAAMDGTYEVVATITDAAGNSTTDTSVAELVRDSNPPVAPEVDAIDDGNNVSPAISGTAHLEPGDVLRVEVTDSTGAVIHTFTMADLTLTETAPGIFDWEVTTVPALPRDDTYGVQAFTTDSNGNESASDANGINISGTPPEVFTIEAAPTVTTDGSVVDHTLATGTPYDGTGPLTISGTAALGTGESLRVTLDGVVYDSTTPELVVGNGLGGNGVAVGAWELTLPAAGAPADGSYDVLVEVLDANGAVLAVDAPAASGDIDLDVDTTAPDVPTIDPVNTIDPSPVLTGTVGPDALTADETLIVTVTDTSATTTTKYGVVADLANGVEAGLVITGTSWSLDLGALTPPVTLSTSTTMPDTVDAVVTDAAGNSAAADQVTASIVAGGVSVDVQETANTTPLITGLADFDPAAGDTLTVTVDGISYDIDTASLASPTSGVAYDAATGVWSVQIPATQAIAPNTAAYDVAATINFAAGGTATDSTSGELTVLAAPRPTVDALPDVVTDVTQPLTLTGTVDTSIFVNGQYLEVTVTNAAGTTTVSTFNSLISGEMTVHTLTGVWTATLPANALTTGNGDNYHVVATVKSATGGTAVIDSGTAGGAPEIVVDTDAPTGAAAVSTVDGTTLPSTVTNVITGDATPVITGSATVGTNETLQVTIGSDVYTAGDGALSFDSGSTGNWTLNIPAANALAEGTYDIQVAILDENGNASTDPTTNELRVDLTGPTAPTLDPIPAGNDTTPTLTGTAVLEADPTATGVDLVVTVGTDVYKLSANQVQVTPALTGTTTYPAIVNWELTPPTTSALPVGATQDVTVSVTDPYGNASTATGTAEIYPLPTVDLLETNDSSPDITGTVQLGADEKLVVSVDLNTGGNSNFVPFEVGGTPNWLSVDPVAGTWTLAYIATLSAGNHQIKVEVQDAAGTPLVTVDDAATELVIDLTAPLAPTVDTYTGDPTDTTPDLTGTLGNTLAPDETVVVQIGGHTYSWTQGADNAGNPLQVTPTGNGNITVTAWSLTPPPADALPAGTYDVTVTHTDVAGNSSTDISTNEVTLVDQPVVTVTPIAKTADATPILEGTVTFSAAYPAEQVLKVTVNGVVYDGTQGNLVLTPVDPTDPLEVDYTWMLEIPLANALNDNIYEVLAQVVSTDVTPVILASDGTLNELEIGVPAATNQAPTAVVLTPTNVDLTPNEPEGTTVKVADIAITDDGLGVNNLTVVGADALDFKVITGVAGPELHFIGDTLDFLTKTSYQIAVAVDDVTVGGTPDATSATLIVNVAAPGNAPSANSNLLNGVPGPDTLDGLGGNDVFIGNGGPDVMNGGAGDDTFIINVHAPGQVNLLDGGAHGVLGDTADFSGLAGRLDVNLNYAGKEVYSKASGTWQGVADLANVENIIGSQGNDSITGDAGNNRLDGSAGSDTVKGGGGDDTLVVSDHTAGDIETLDGGTHGLLGDTVDFSGLAGRVDVDLNYGGRFQTYVNDGTGWNGVAAITNVENITTGAGNDELSGNAGNNILDGGAGNNTLEGRGGADIFVFDNDKGHNVITDFETGVDKIDLSGNAEITDFADLQANHFSGTLIDDGAGTVIDVQGYAVLDANDFIF